MHLAITHDYVVSEFGIVSQFTTQTLIPELSCLSPEPRHSVQNQTQTQHIFKSISLSNYIECINNTKAYS